MKKIFFPKYKEELRTILDDEIGKHGNECSLNHIDTSQITDMGELFSYSPFNGDISAWDVSAVKNMSMMFYHSAFNQDISRWDVSSVIYMDRMFSYSDFNQDISCWDVASVEDVSVIFDGNQSIQLTPEWATIPPRKKKKNSLNLMRKQAEAFVHQWGNIPALGMSEARNIWHINAITLRAHKELIQYDGTFWADLSEEEQCDINQNINGENQPYFGFYAGDSWTMIGFKYLYSRYDNQCVRVTLDDIQGRTEPVYDKDAPEGKMGILKTNFLYLERVNQTIWIPRGQAVFRMMSLLRYLTESGIARRPD